MKKEIFFGGIDMTIEELTDRIQELGLKKGAIEKRCGLVPGKLTEITKKRTIITDDIIRKLAMAFEELSEELSIFAEEVRAMDPEGLGQYCVYELSFPDGKKYYGMTVNTKMRWNNGTGYRNQIVGKVIEECGWDNVDKRIIAENLTKDNAMLIERTLIKATGADIPGIGYNIY